MSKSDRLTADVTIAGLCWDSRLPVVRERRAISGRITPTVADELQGMRVAA